MFNPFLIKNKFFSTLVLISAVFLLNFSPAFAGNISKDSIIDLANTSRIQKGLLILSENSKLDLAATKKAQNMLSLNYFDHYSPQNDTPWDFILNSGYDYSFAGENLAIDFATSEGIHKAWLNSPTHARNILNDKFEDIGIAVVEGELNGHTTTLVVQMFGSEKFNLVEYIGNSKLVSQINNLLGVAVELP